MLLSAVSLLFLCKKHGFIVIIIVLSAIKLQTNVHPNVHATVYPKLK